MRHPSSWGRRTRTAPGPRGVGTRFHWGGGFQLGAYYRLTNDWAFGASFKSRQWVEPFRYNSETDTGLPRVVKFRLDYPMIVSIGTSYTGLKDWTFALDLRYFDYSNTTGFNSMAIAPDGRVEGLGWNSIMSVCLGVERRLTENLFVRAGYCFNENPIGTDAVLTNVASPLLCKHSLHIGASYGFAENWVASISYTRCFEESTRGPISLGGGEHPGCVGRVLRLCTRRLPGGVETILECKNPVAFREDHRAQQGERSFSWRRAAIAAGTRLSFPFPENAIPEWDGIRFVSSRT